MQGAAAMIRLSPHRARDRAHAWQEAADIVFPIGSRFPDSMTSQLNSWYACCIHRNLWSRIEDSLWELRHSRIRNSLTAAVRKQKRRP
jgi:hypothetical protein